MTTTSSDKYFRIRLSTIRGHKPSPFDIYVFIDGRYITYLRAGDRLDDQKIDTLNFKDTGNSFFVLDSEKQTYRDYVKAEMNSDELNPFEKAKILRESSIAILEDLFETPDVGVALENSKPIVNDLIQFMGEAPEAVGDLISLSGHDFYTYNHSFDVSIYSLGLAQVLGFTKNDLVEMGQGSLFHDIGKRNVSLDILCKKGPLDEHEWAQMKMHPQYGLVILNEHAIASDAIKAACFEHHESWAGGGYPQGISGPEIHPFARIVAITDTYDAMTTQRSYNVPLKPHDALAMMRDKLAGRYDPEMLKAMYSVLFKLKSAA